MVIDPTDGSVIAAEGRLMVHRDIKIIITSNMFNVTVGDDVKFLDSTGATAVRLIDIGDNVTLHVVTDIEDPIIVNKGDGAFHPINLP